MRGFSATVAAAIVGCLALAVPVGAAEFAPLDQKGPKLSVSKPKLRSALSCTGNLSSGGDAPVLFVAGTTVTPREDFSWNWLRDLDRRGIPHCEIEVPERSNGDIQIAAEYIVYAIRTMERIADRDVDIFGHSQGGMSPRWALRFWPKLRTKVDDLVGAAASNHGTVTTNILCTAACPTAFWQQDNRARFIEAVNSRTETFKTVDYTALYTRLDEVVVPNFDDSGSTSLRARGPNVSNVAVQDLCPLNLAEHLAVGTYDNAAYAIARDALDNPGPADLSRISTSECSKLLMPGVDQATFATEDIAAATFLATSIAGARQVAGEPKLACYVKASCRRRR